MSPSVVLIRTRVRVSGAVLVLVLGFVLELDEEQPTASTAIAASAVFMTSILMAKRVTEERGVPTWRARVRVVPNRTSTPRRVSASRSRASSLSANGEGALSANGEGALSANGEGALSAKVEGALSVNGRGARSVHPERGVASRASEASATRDDESKGPREPEAVTLASPPLEREGPEHGERRPEPSRPLGERAPRVFAGRDGLLVGVRRTTGVDERPIDGGPGERAEQQHRGAREDSPQETRPRSNGGEHVLEGRRRHGRDVRRRAPDEVEDASDLGDLSAAGLAAKQVLLDPSHRGPGQDLGKTRAQLSAVHGSPPGT